MDDLTITKLCAEAMGIELVEINPVGFAASIAPYAVQRFGGEYRPLHDDAQAMALVKRFTPIINRDGWDGGPWAVMVSGESDRGLIPSYLAEDADLNRAICLCVARLQQAKQK